MDELKRIQRDLLYFRIQWARVHSGSSDVPLYDRMCDNLSALSVSRQRTIQLAIWDLDNTYTHMCITLAYNGLDWACILDPIRVIIAAYHFTLKQAHFVLNTLYVDCL